MQIKMKKRAPMAIAPLEYGVGRPAAYARSLSGLARDAERAAPRPLELVVRAGGLPQRLGCWWDLRYPRRGQR